jgi:hypothetical protein
LNQLRDLGDNTKFLLPPGECLPSTLPTHTSVNDTLFSC